MIETQATIQAWADETFGHSTDALCLAVRANTEMAELLRALAAPDSPEACAEECADVMIVLYRVANVGRHDLHQAIRTESLGSAYKGTTPLHCGVIALETFPTIIFDCDEDAGTIDPSAMYYVTRIALILVDICERLGKNLGAEVDKKMAINRTRRWKKGGDGSQHHVRVA